MLLGGSAGGGKTPSLLMCAIRACVQHPGLRGLLGRDRGHRQVEVAADHLGDLAGWHALLGDPVQNRPGRRLLQRKAEQARGVEPVPPAGQRLDPSPT